MNSILNIFNYLVKLNNNIIKNNKILHYKEINILNIINQFNKF